MPGTVACRVHLGFFQTALYQRMSFHCVADAGIQGVRLSHVHQNRIDGVLPA